MNEKKDKLNQRSDKFSLILNDNELHSLQNAEYIKRKVMCDEKAIVFVAVIKHDRDRNEETNELKTIHYHMVIQFGGVYRIGTIIKWLSDLLKINENQIQVEKCNSMSMQCRYLTHLDDFDKEQYNLYEIATNDTNVLARYYKLVIIRDLADCIACVRQYNYNLEEIMAFISNYDKWRKYINDLINNFYRRR